MATVISGAMVASIQLGTGFVSKIIGLLNTKIPLDTLFQSASIYAFLMGAIVVYLQLLSSSKTEFKNE